MLLIPGSPADTAAKVRRPPDVSLILCGQTTADLVSVAPAPVRSVVDQVATPNERANQFDLFAQRMLLPIEAAIACDIKCQLTGHSGLRGF